MSALSERDLNARASTDTSQTSETSANSAFKADPKPRHTLMKSSGTTDSNGTYVSPSDAIMSPASQKLAGFKQRQINKQHNPTRRTLFARSTSTSSDPPVDENQTSARDA